ncbi:MAG: hypothetical protein COB08_006935 [Rhodobacteraceae bacterium]|nr:hypothetical protein [Paracoccaceae bacterium]
MIHNTTIGRTILAMFAGALVGGTLSMGVLIAGFGPPAAGESLQVWLIVQAYWLGGIAIFALIPFVLMHFSNLRHWYAMTLMGVLTMVMLGNYAFKGIGQGGSIFVLAGVGGIVGWVIWRVAYRPSAP